MSRLDDIKAREAAATEGPWFYRPLVLGAPSTTVMSGDRQVGYFSVGQAIPTDATFIAHARQDIPWLVERIDAVLALHTPFEWSFGYGPVRSCRECMRLGAQESTSAYPCPTVRALGVES